MRKSRLFKFAGLILLLWLVWRLNRRRLGLDLLVLWSFVCNPLVHDYDLIQLVPLLDTPRLRLAALVMSVAGLLVILFAYANDQAWYVYTFITHAAPISLFPARELKRTRYYPRVL